MLTVRHLAQIVFILFTLYNLQAYYFIRKADAAFSVMKFLVRLFVMVICIALLVSPIPQAKLGLLVNLLIEFAYVILVVIIPTKLINRLVDFYEQYEKLTDVPSKFYLIAAQLICIPPIVLLITR